MANYRHQEEDQAKRREKEPQESDGMGSPRSNTAAERKEHVCQVCHRRFISGKALGGHVSAHVQARKAKNRIIGLEQEEDFGEEIQEDDDEEEDQINVCFICQKHFPSKKSLYGHMRSHPDRAWRGLRRRAAAEEEPAQEAAAVVDLQSRLKHWGATVKRSRTKQMEDAAAAVAPRFRHLLEVADKEERRMRSGGGGGGGDFGSTQTKKKKIKGKGKGKADEVWENPRFGGVEIKRSSSCSSDEDTDEYYCKNHMDEIINNGGILNPKEIHRKNHRNKESLEVKSELAEEEKKRSKYGSQALGKPHNNNNKKVKIEEIIIPSITNDENQTIGAHRRVESRRKLQVAASPEILTAASIPKVLRIDLNEMPEADTASGGGI